MATEPFLIGEVTVVCLAYLLTAPWAPEGSRGAKQSPGGPCRHHVIGSSTFRSSDRYPRLHALCSITTWMQENLHRPAEPSFRRDDKRVNRVSSPSLKWQQIGGERFCCVCSCGEAQSEVRQLYVENVIHWQVSVKGVYRRAIQQLLQVASLRCNNRSDAETRVSAAFCFPPFPLSTRGSL